MSIFNDKSLKSVAEAAAKIMRAEATKPETEKEKKLAALGHPKDKITHKDVLIGRGVLKKENTEVAKEEMLQEGWKEMMAATKERSGPQPSGGAGIKQGTRYGGGRQKDEPEQEEEKPAKRKYGARQNFKRSTRVNEGFTAMLEKYDQEGLKSLFTMVEEPDNEQFTGELKRQERKAAGTAKKDELADVADAGEKAVRINKEEIEVEVFDANEINGVKMDTIEERSLTEPETKKKEEIVMSMKKKMPGFKERYGERAKSVMYATATKMAKKD